jgi:membrane-associated protease RseP (regulator of RpoE activity)
MFGLLVFLVGVMCSIAIHELGHLWAAKRAGARVSEFMVGFGPRLLSFKKGHTSYGLKLLPFGGYVRILGMHAPGKGFDRPESESEAAVPGTDFYRLSVTRRTAILLAGVTMNFLFAALLLLVVLVGFGLPRASNTVSVVSSCVSATTCTDLDPVSPARSAGLLPGDQVVSIDDRPVGEWGDLTAVLAERRPGDVVELAIVSGEGERVVDVELTEHPLFPGRGFLGVSPEVVFVSESPTRVVPLLGEQSRMVAGTLAGFPARVYSAFTSTLTGTERDPAGAVSIVGAGRLGAELGSGEEPLRARLGQLLVLLAGLNVSLAVFNLIPLVPLDGGHVAVTWFEGIRSRLARLRGRPDPGHIDHRRLLPLTQLVVAFVILSSLALIFADIANPISLP